jgi:hypothetical protein
MSTTQIKELLHQRIEQVDESFLNVLYAMMEAYIKEQEEAALEEEIMNMPPPPNWKPFTQEELIAEIEEANDEIDRGEYITLEDLKKEVEEW